MGNQTSGKLSFDDISYQLNRRRYEPLNNCQLLQNSFTYNRIFDIIYIINVSFLFNDRHNIIIMERLTMGSEQKLSIEFNLSKTKKHSTFSYHTAMKC